MASPLKRFISPRNLLLLRSSLNRPREFSRTISSNTPNSSPKSPIWGAYNGGCDRLGFDFTTRRGFAKGRKSSKDKDEGSTIQVVPDFGPIKETASSQMDAAVIALSRELSKIRTGRASAGMLDHIIVETSGVKMSLNRIAVVSVLESQKLSVTPYDPNTIKELEHAINSSPLGLNPQVDGQRLVVPIPRLTKEHVQAMCKVVAKSCEDVKQSIRRARQKAIDTIKKAASQMPKDDVKRLEKEVEELTKKFIKSAEDMCKLKEKEITSS
ncbi:hypothetical protein Scep_021028 [Stephania cephalantha]|uniref:Ribosome-recycling factor, chloroplastic n=1 Tax=Stephania cephalantha TaxID=152367 RepID=A0AAP0FC55_9MAGN